VTLAVRSYTVVHLNETKAAVNVYHFPIRPQMSGDVHLLGQSMGTDKVDEIANVEQVVNLPSHLVAVLVAGSRSAQGQGDLALLVGERKSHGFRSGDDAKRLCDICGLVPENLTIDVGIGLGDELHRIDLCNKKVEYMRGEMPSVGRKNKRTFAGIVPGLVPVDGGHAGKECRATNVGGDGVLHTLVAPSMLQTSDALNGVFVAPGQAERSLRVGTRRVHPAVEILVDLTRFAFVVWFVRAEGLGATSNSPE